MSRFDLRISFSLLLCCAASCEPSQAAERPNFVVILCDNLGYGDLGCFGSTAHRTPHLDRMAQEGMRLTSFYVSAGVCTPSRASFMTGCYAQRLGLHWTDRDAWVLRPMSPYGLNAKETTIAEVLSSAGYATGLVGKWHLGDQPEFLPTRHGFDTYFGIPYSDDMTPRTGDARRESWPPLPLMIDERVVEAPVNRSTLTARYTDAAIEFMADHRDEPFFLFLSHAMPGSTKQPFASTAFRGQSKNGAFGDAVEELDWSTGQILSAIRQLGIDRRTLVVWTSDNGAPKRNPPQGSAGPLKGFGYNTSEGAMRVCCIARWPGRVPADTVCDELTTSMDLLPTFTGLARAKLNVEVDGRDIRPLLMGTAGATSPHEAFFYYHNRQLQAVRDDQFKLYLPLDNKLVGGRQATVNFVAELYDLKNDIGETQNLIAAHPDVAKRLSEHADRARADLGDLGRRGTGQRSPGRVDMPTPRTLDVNAR